MKRFTETTKWDDPWFRRLSPAAKLLWGYITDKCDLIGLIELDFESASFHAGCKISIEHLAEIDSRIQRLDTGKLFILRFIHFQYGELSTECRAHFPIFKAISAHGLVKNGTNYEYPIDRVSIPFKNKTGKGTGQEGGVGEGELPLNGNPTIAGLVPECPPISRKPFTKPTLAAVKLQCVKIGLPEETAEEFINHYESNGWKVGPVKMASWTHALQTWKRNFDNKRFQKHEHNTRTGIDRNAGTFNANISEAELAALKRKVR